MKTDSRPTWARCSAIVTGHAGRESPRPCRLWAVVGDALGLCWLHAKNRIPISVNGRRIWPDGDDDEGGWDDGDA